MQVVKERTRLREQMSRARVAVLMPVYNGARFLRVAVESILSQTFRDFDFLIVDDGSTDESPAILREYAARDSRIRIESQPNAGIAGALNVGLTLTQATYVARMDADDIASPERLERQLAVMESDSSVVACGTQAEEIDAEGQIRCAIQYPTTSVRLKLALLTKPPFLHPTTMLRRSALLAAGGYTSGCPIEDCDLWWKLATRGNFACTPDVLLRYRVHGANYAIAVSHGTTQLHDSLVADYMQRYGLARSVSEVEHYIDFVRRDLWERRHETQPLTRSHFRAAGYVLSRFFELLVGEDANSIREASELQRELRWDYLNRAAMAGRFSRLSLEWTWLACCVDRIAMRPHRIAGRALRQIARRCARWVVPRQTAETASQAGNS
jgi:glycosyltransferase involved in cell wall biosynthesis